MESTRDQDQQWEDIVDETMRSLPTAIPSYPLPTIQRATLAKYIDHTLLKLDATQGQVDALCTEAREYNFKSCCVRLDFVERAVKNLQGSDVVVACVVGFHEGSQPVEAKVAEAKEAVLKGALELDMVLDYRLLPVKQYTALLDSIHAVRSAAPAPVVLKVILETSQLSRREIVAACLLCERGKADFVKTSTGFTGHGATTEHVGLMKQLVHNHTPGRLSRRASRQEGCRDNALPGATSLHASGRFAPPSPRGPLMQAGSGSHASARLGHRSQHARQSSPRDDRTRFNVETIRTISLQEASPRHIAKVAARLGTSESQVMAWSSQGLVDYTWTVSPTPEEHGHGLGFRVSPNLRLMLDPSCPWMRAKQEYTQAHGKQKESFWGGAFGKPAEKS
ncbi:MAG: hypothetical protein M1838_005712, partial [Thelocarpon superellum]